MAVVRGVPDRHDSPGVVLQESDLSADAPLCCRRFPGLVPRLRVRCGEALEIIERGEEGLNELSVHLTRFDRTREEPTESGVDDPHQPGSPDLYEIGAQRSLEQVRLRSSN